MPLAGWCTCTRVKCVPSQSTQALLCYIYVNLPIRRYCYRFTQHLLGLTCSPPGIRHYACLDRNTGLVLHPAASPAQVPPCPKDHRHRRRGPPRQLKQEKQHWGRHRCNINVGVMGRDGQKLSWGAIVHRSQALLVARLRLRRVDYHHTLW